MKGMVDGGNLNADGSTWGWREADDGDWFWYASGPHGRGNQVGFANSHKEAYDTARRVHDELVDAFEKDQP